MWASLSLLLTLCVLHGGSAESDGGGQRCQLPPAWNIGEASRVESLRQNLESQGLKDVVYMVINHQGAQAQRLHVMLERRLSGNITLFKQDELQPDVWQTLGGEKDDFFIYDRCGRLTNRISLPYSIIGHGHIENAIKETYCKRLCGDCSHESAEVPEECREKADGQPDEGGKPAESHQIDHSHHHGHPHGHHHGHHHHHHHHHGHGHHQEHTHDQDLSHSQHHVEVEQMQHDAPVQDMSKDQP